ncbi:MAG: carbamate kinase [Thermoplasmata archaeon]|nr:carbamate kinase [Thermoplasmata archaeon]
MMDKIVIAVGGNALQRPGDKGTAKEQMKRAQETAESISWIFDNYQVALTHGNGPQVGMILLQNEQAKDIVPPMPLDVCGAESQGMIGYMLEQGFNNAIKSRKLNKDLITILTRVEVDENDPAFKNPTKPIGPFYTRFQAQEIIREKGWKMVEDSGRGWRRVVPSPEPMKIIEKDAIISLMDNGFIVIAVGGGGIPVIRRNGNLIGVEGVIDKDLGAATLGKDIGAKELIILTAVEKVYLNYGKENQVPLDSVNIKEIQEYYKQGHFKPGSMGPKILAAIKFISNGGRKVLITSPESLKDAFEEKNGTWIYP